MQIHGVRGDCDYARLSVEFFASNRLIYVRTYSYSSVAAGIEIAVEWGPDLSLSVLTAGAFGRALGWDPFQMP